MSEFFYRQGRTHVFAYGSNLDVPRMVARVPSATVVGPSRLVGYELRFHKRGWVDGTGKANAYATGHAQAVVHGVIYEVDERELIDLDVHETGYERKLLEFALSAPESPTGIGAWTYLAHATAIDDGLTPAKWYLDHVLGGARQHALPRELIEWLHRHPTEG